LMDIASSAPFLRDAWFGQIAPERQALLLAEGRIRPFRNQQRIYRLGDPPNGLYGLISGEVRLISYPVVGRQLLVARLEPGGWFGELSTVDGGPRPQDAISFGPSKVLHISSRDFERISRDNPEIFRDVARLLGQRQRTAVQYAGMTVSLPAKVRLSHLLLAALDTSGKPHSGAERTISLTQSDIATALGASRQTTNKLLKSLEQTGAVSLGYRRITVQNPARLHLLSKAIRQN
jgi:CRP/FNR family transcriptional regulator, cyclic AMP receptor protein